MKSHTNACDLLTDQHAEVDRLFAATENAKDRETKAAAFAELADKLAAHAKIEEVYFYPMVMDDDTKDMLLESAEEHLAIKRVLADMIAMDCEDDEFDAKLKVVKEQVSHHAHEEEEEKLFPKVRAAFDDDALEACGGEMLREFLELLEGEPRLDVPQETDHAAPIPTGL